LISEEGFTKDQSDRTKALLNAVATYGIAHVPYSVYLKVPKLLLKYKMTVQQVTSLYTKYIGNWGESAVEYRFDAIKKGQVIKSVVKAPMKQCVLHAEADHTNLKDGHSYDVALVRIRMSSEHGQTLQFSHEPVFLKTEGPIEIIGPSCVVLQGGMAGTYVRSLGKGSSRLILSDQRNHEVVIEFENKGE
jgi:beta-galactosidase